MRRLLALLVLTAGLVPFGGGTAWACSCDPADDVQRIVDELADAVYVGEVLRVEQSHYVVRVDRSLRGRVSGTRTVRRSGSCDMFLRPGRVFMTEIDGRSSSCESLTAQGREVDFATRRWERVNGVEAEAGGAGRDRTPALLLATLLAAVLSAGIAVSARRRSP